MALKEETNSSEKSFPFPDVVVLTGKKPQKKKSGLGVTLEQ